MNKEELNDFLEMATKFRDTQLESHMKFQEALLMRQRETLEFCKEIDHYIKGNTKDQLHGEVDPV